MSIVLKTAVLLHDHGDRRDLAKKGRVRPSTSFAPAFFWEDVFQPSS